MVVKAPSAAEERIAEPFGRAPDEEMLAVSRSLAVCPG